MAGDKFDFTTAERLVMVIDKSASAIDVKNGQIEKKFGELHEYFKDSGYSDYESDMRAANDSIDEIIKQLKQVGKSVAEYAQRLRDEAM